MTGLPLISGNECIRALGKIGYVKSHQKGSHVRLVCSHRAPVTVPLHDELDRETLSSIVNYSYFFKAVFVFLGSS